MPSTPAIKLRFSPHLLSSSRPCRRGPFRSIPTNHSVYAQKKLEAICIILNTIPQYCNKKSPNYGFCSRLSSPVVYSASLLAFLKGFECPRVEEIHSVGTVFHRVCYPLLAGTSISRHCTPNRGYTMSSSAASDYSAFYKKSLLTPSPRCWWQNPICEDMSKSEI